MSPVYNVARVIHVTTTCPGSKFRVHPYTSPPSSNVSTEELKSHAGSSYNRIGLWEVQAERRSSGGLGSGGFGARPGEGPAIDSGLRF